MKTLTKILLTLLVVAFLLLEGVNIYLSNKVSLESISASKVRNQIAKLQEKNQVLSGEILDYTSYEYIASRAGELGFHEEKDFVSLYAPVQVAIGR